MKVLQSSFFRALCAIIIGVLLVKYREETVTWITIAIGVLFFLSGVVSCAAYFGSRKEAARRSSRDAACHVSTDSGAQTSDVNCGQISGSRPMFPIVGIGSIILGIILALMPGTFVVGLMYILAAVLIIGAINQFICLGSVTKFTHVGFYYWIMPSIILLVGLIAIIKPTAIASAPLFVIGWCMLLYGVVECINTIKIMVARKKNAAANADMDETSKDENTQMK